MREVKEDLFQSEDNLCHCVSADMYMGKGIAVEFRRRWGRPHGTFHIGDIAIIKDKERYIIYLVTKDRYWEKPIMPYLEMCLHKVAALGLHSLSMPRIGCGLDRLHWEDVSKSIEAILFGMDITVYTL